MSFFTEERAQLIFDRTKKNFDDTVKYAQKHPMEASIAIGALFVATILFPTPVILTLTIGALALLAINAFTPPSAWENVSNLFSS